MLSQNGCRSAGLSQTQAHASDGQTRLVAVDLAVNAFLNPPGHSRFHLFRLSFGRVQPCEALLPLRQCGIAQHGILNRLVALIFGVKHAHSHVRLGGANEILQRGIDQS